MSTKTRLKQQFKSASVRDNAQSTIATLRLRNEQAGVDLPLEIGRRLCRLVRHDAALVGHGEVGESEVAVAHLVVEPRLLAQVAAVVQLLRPPAHMTYTQLHGISVHLHTSHTHTHTLLHGFSVQLHT